MAKKLVKKLKNLKKKYTQKIVKPVVSYLVLKTDFPIIIFNEESSHCDVGTKVGETNYYSDLFDSQTAQSKLKWPHKLSL